jgi:RimJ/RimL family protein N-acetyltransferase
MIDVAFRDLNAHRVVARLDARNDASRHLLERLGMRREAHLVQNEFIKGEWTDELIFAVLEGEWALEGDGDQPSRERQ